MSKESNKLVNQNHERLKQQVTNEEFTRKSESVNYFSKQACEQDAYFEYVQMKIDRGLKSGFAKKLSREELLTEFKNRLSI